MNKHLARQLEVHGDLQLEPEYTGRGMGNPTAAVVGSQEAFYEAISSLVDSLVNDALECTTDEEKAKLRAEYEELSFDSIGSIRVDSLGKTDLVFY
jgi:hypothetical protein